MKREILLYIVVDLMKMSCAHESWFYGCSLGQTERKRNFRGGCPRMGASKALSYLCVHVFMCVTWHCTCALEIKGQQPFFSGWWVELLRAGSSLIVTYHLTDSHPVPFYMPHLSFHFISHTVTLERPSKYQRPWLLTQIIIRWGYLSTI